MGQDKAQIMLGGRTLLERALDALAQALPAGEEVDGGGRVLPPLVTVRGYGHAVCQGDFPEKGQEQNAPIQDGPYQNVHLQTVQDSLPDQGPLAGLVAGMEALAGKVDAVLVAAVDMPFYTPPWMAPLVRRLDTVGGCCWRWAGVANPLAAAYRMDLLPRLDDLYRQGGGAPRQVFAAPRFHGFAVTLLDLEDHWGGSPPSPLMDLDTPQDVLQAVEWFSR